MSVRTAAIIAASCLVGGLVAGCANTAPPAARIDPTSGTPYPNITVEPALGGFLVYRPAIVEKGDVLKVTVPVRLESRYSTPISVQYKYTFKDGNGVPLRSQSGWQFVQLEPRMERTLQGNALDSNAADWQLEIRSGR